VSFKSNSIRLGFPKDNRIYDTSDSQALCGRVITQLLCIARPYSPKRAENLKQTGWQSLLLTHGQLRSVLSCTIVSVSIYATNYMKQQYTFGRFRRNDQYLVGMPAAISCSSFTFATSCCIRCVDGSVEVVGKSMIALPILTEGYQRKRCFCVWRSLSFV
jgi:hypothetical protein